MSKSARAPKEGVTSADYPSHWESPVITSNMKMTAEEFGQPSDRMTKDKGTLTQVFRATGGPLPTPATFRIRVVRDPYEFQSYATAEIMADDRSWTHLISIHPAKWHSNTRSENDYKSVARQLLKHVQQIFGIAN